MLRSFGFIPCGFEEVVTLLFLEEVADLPDCLPELVVCAGCGFSDQGLELGKCHFDRVEIRGVWRQEQEPRTDVFQDGGGLRAAVGGEVVQVRRIRK